MSVPDNATVRAALGLNDDVLAINAGSNGPLCRAAAEAIEASCRDMMQPASAGGPGYIQYYEEVARRDREEVAALINCDPEDIALCESTTVALNILLWGIDLKPGDEILTTSLENPAALIPLRVYAGRFGAVLRTLELGNGDVDIASAFQENVTKRTRLVLASDVNCVTGARLDLKALTHIAHEHDVLVFGDGVQAAGTCAIDVRDSGIDGYAIARHKFLCGPAGAGALYVSPDVLESIQPTFTGCFSDAYHGDNPYFTPFRGARRFEVSTRFLPAIAGATAAVKWLAGNIGWEGIFAHTREIASEVRQSLASLERVSVLTPGDAPGALTALTVNGCDAADVVKNLKQYGVSTRPIKTSSSREGQGPLFAIRLSLGFWNRQEDVGQIVEAFETAIAATCET